MSQDRRFLTAFNDVLRSGPLRETANLQEAGFAASQLVDQTPEGQPMDLGPLYTFLLERQNPKAETQQTFMALLDKVREMGIVVREPDEIARLSDSQRSGLMRRYSRERQKTTGYQREPDAPAGKPAAKAKNPNKRGKKGAGPNQSLKIATGIVLVAGVVAVVVMQATKLPTLEPVVVTNARGLQCDKLMGNPPTLICTMKKAAFQKTDRDIQEDRARITLKAAGAGYKRVHVEDPKGFPLMSVMVP
jgi:hypothetical protein